MAANDYLEGYLLQAQTDPEAFELGVRMGYFAKSRKGTKAAREMIELQIRTGLTEVEGVTIRCGFVLGHKIAGIESQDPPVGSKHE